jgi:hypothetical protein
MNCTLTSTLLFIQEFTIKLRLVIVTYLRLPKLKLDRCLFLRCQKLLNSPPRITSRAVRFEIIGELDYFCFGLACCA